MAEVDQILKRIEKAEEELESERARLQEWVARQVEPFSLREAAQRLGVSYQHISYIRHDTNSAKGKLRVSTLVNLAKKIRDEDVLS